MLKYLIISKGVSLKIKPPGIRCSASQDTSIVKHCTALYCTTLAIPVSSYCDDDAQVILSNGLSLKIRPPGIRCRANQVISIVQRCTALLSPSRSVLIESNHKSPPTVPLKPKHSYATIVCNAITPLQLYTFGRTLLSYIETIKETVIQGNNLYNVTTYSWVGSSESWRVRELPEAKSPSFVTARAVCLHCSHCELAWFRTKMRGQSEPARPLENEVQIALVKT